MIKTFKNIWQKNRLGSVMFIVGIFLCTAGILLSLFWKIGLSSISENAPYVVSSIGIGFSFMLTGINIISLPPRLPRWYAGIYKKYIEENEILIIEFVASIVFMILLFKSFPYGWHYPQIYILIIPYAISIFLMIFNILFNIGEKDNEIIYIRRELDATNTIMKESQREKQELKRDNAAPEYVIEFADMLKRNIDEIKSVMDDLKLSIDDGTKSISERTTSMANKYRIDNEQLHNDVQKFKQRMEKDKEEFKERANERIIKNLMKTIENIDDILKYNKNTYLIKEIEGIKQNILNTFKEEGIEIINPSIGEDFDDKKCCAIQTVETDKFPEKKIVDIKKIGCMFKSGKIIKYADVIVSKNKEKINIKDVDKIKKEDEKPKDKIKTDTILIDEKVENTKVGEDKNTDKIDKIREDMKVESQ